MIKKIIWKYMCYRKTSSYIKVQNAIVFIPRKAKGYISHVLLSISRTRLNTNLARLHELNHLVVSPGGVGTTFLIDHLAKFIEINDVHDADGLKHLPSLTREQRRGKKVLFITGEFASIYNSLERRGWLRIQSAKLGCILCQFTYGNVRKKLFASAVTKQMLVFKEYQLDTNIMFIKYSEIWSRKIEIGDFFCIGSEEFSELFPEKRERTSKI